MSITKHEAPVISKNALVHIITCLLPRKLGRDSNMYDVGYEAAKSDIATIVGKQLDMDLSINPAKELIKSLKRSDD